MNQLVRLVGAKCVGPFPKSGSETSHWGLKLVVARAFTRWKSANMTTWGSVFVSPENQSSHLCRSIANDIFYITISINAQGGWEDLATDIK